jgi:hypothetical protein
MKKEKYGFVYIWRDRKHKRYYVGCHWGTEDDGYICSSSWMTKAYKRRPEDFRRRVLARIITNRFDLYEEEHRWLQMMKQEEIKGPRYYNQLSYRFSHWSEDPNNRLTLSEKISIKTKEAMQRPEIREKFLKGYSKRKKMTNENDRDAIVLRNESIKEAYANQELRDIHRINAKNLWSKEEHKQKRSDAMKALWNNPEYRKKIIEKSTGRKLSQEARDKISNAHRGRKHTDDTKANMSLAAKHRWKEVDAKVYT